MSLVAIALVLLGTVNERILGTVTDEQVLLSTSLALGMNGELGVAREAAIAVHRPGGDAVAPYGLVWPALLAPVMRAAAPFERAFGDRSSQSLLALLPIALVVLAAGGAGLLARELGANGRGQAIAAFATALGSPLWAYASTVFTEPLQAAVFVFALLHAVRGNAWRAGFIAGLAVLVKAVNLAVLPIVLVPILWPQADRRFPWLSPAGRLAMARACVGAALPLAAWVALDIARFGSPLGGYFGQHFSHPPLDGLWRLLIGSNEGLLVFFPMLVLSIVGLVTLTTSPRTRAAGLAIAGTCGGLLALMSAWWAWDGSSGWGPRLLMPTIPLLAAAAGSTIGAGTRGSLPRVLAPALLGLGICVNSLGIAQADISASFYVDSCGPVIVPDEEVPWFPDGLAISAPPGERRISRSMAAARDAAFAPVSTHLFLISARLQDEPERTIALTTPPWIASHPDAIPRVAGHEGELSGVLARDVSGALRWPHWGAALAADDATRGVEFHGAWRDAVIDQTLRALDMGRPERAIVLARPLWEISKSPLAAALLAEALRESGDAKGLESLVRSLPPAAHASPEVAVVLALVARDHGLDAMARGLLRQAEPAFPTPALRAALDAPLSDWPATYRALTH